MGSSMRSPGRAVSDRPVLASIIINEPKGSIEMVICVPVTVEGLIDPRWGRADRVAIAEATANGVADWQEFDVGWDALHDAGTEGSHHARVARFLRDHHVDAVVAHHMGMGMAHMLEQMGVKAYLGASGDARAAVTTAIQRGEALT